MQPSALAALHARCFTTPRPWQASEFESLLATKGVFLISHKNGFAVGRIAGPEAELLTIAVQPSAQNSGHGRRLLDDFLLKAAKLEVKDVFLEVAENNKLAIGLYKSCGFIQIAERVDYFKQNSGPALTALIFKYLI